jgi:iron complex outermembrane recepter protein
VYEWKVGAQVNNLLNSRGENHVSYLKEFAPLPGRNISLNSSISF